MSKILRFAEVHERTGLSRATVYRRVRAGTFPTPLDLGNGQGHHQLGWIAEEIDQWVEARPRHVPQGHGRRKAEAQSQGAWCAARQSSTNDARQADHPGERLIQSATARSANDGSSVNIRPRPSPFKRRARSETWDARS